MADEPQTLDIRQIMEILPHRYPLLLIDRITALEPGKRATGYKNITANEQFFVGHFPGNPVMPGVYMVEALAQLGGTIVLAAGDVSRKTPYLVGINNFKFRRPVVPGDVLLMETTILRMRQSIGFVEAVARVGDVIACSGELMFSVVPDTGAFTMDAAVLHQ